MVLPVVDVFVHIQAAALAFNCLFKQTNGEEGGGVAPSSSFKNLISALWSEARRAFEMQCQRDQSAGPGGQMSPASAVCGKVRDRGGSVSHQNQPMDTNSPFYRLFVIIDSSFRSFCISLLFTLWGFLSVVCSFSSMFGVKAHMHHFPFPQL